MTEGKEVKRERVCRLLALSGKGRLLRAAASLARRLLTAVAGSFMAITFVVGILHAHQSGRQQQGGIQQQQDAPPEMRVLIEALDSGEAVKRAAAAIELGKIGPKALKEKEKFYDEIQKGFHNLPGDGAAGMRRVRRP